MHWCWEEEEETFLLALFAPKVQDKRKATEFIFSPTNQMCAHGEKKKEKKKASIDHDNKLVAAPASPFLF